MHIFKKLSKAKAEVKSNMEKYKSDEEFVKIESSKLEALEVISDYIDSMSWIRRKNALNKYKALVAHNFNSEKVANYLGTSVGSVKTSITYLSNQIEEKIGKNTIELILEGNIQTAMLQFRVGTGYIDMSKVIDNGIYNMIEFGEAEGQLISDCESELKFLKALTFKSIQARLSTLSKDKLALIDKIMSSNDMLYAKERVLIYKYLDGEITNVNTLFDMIRVADNYSI